MSEIENRYAAMWASARAAFDSGRFHVDPLIDAPADPRRGLTLRVALAGETLENARIFQERLRAIEPSLYLAGSGEAHVTVLSIVSCAAERAFDAESEAAYADVVQDALSGIEPFAIDFRGIVASPEGVMLRGYPAGEGLATARGRLRAAFADSALFSTIDGRYRAVTAHSTIVRFRASVARSAEFVAELDAFRDQSFGALEVGAVELVRNDWWHRPANTRRIALFPLS